MHFAPSPDTLTPLLPYERQAFERQLAGVLAHDMLVFLEIARKAQLRCYALVNVGQCGEVDERCQNSSTIAQLVQRHDLDAQQLFRHTPEAALAGIGPWLIELPVISPNSVASPDLLQDLALEAGVVQALSLIASPFPPAQLAAHLRSWLHGVISPDPTIAGDEAMGAVIRWYDPRTGFDLVSLLPDSEQHNFLRAFSWVGWDAQFELRGLQCSNFHALETSERAEPLALNRALLLKFAPLAEAEDLLADVLEQAEMATFAHIATALQRWIAIDQVQAAKALGITDRETCATLLHQALSLHPNLSRLPGLKERLANEASSGRGLAHVLDAQTPAWWQGQRDAAPTIWAQWAHHFLAPLIARQKQHASQWPLAALLKSATEPHR